MLRVDYRWDFHGVVEFTVLIEFIELHLRLRVDCAVLSDHVLCLLEVLLAAMLSAIHRKV